MLTEEQKLYLEGFIRGVSAKQGGIPAGLPPDVAAALGTSVASSSGSDVQHPLHQQAQDRVLAAGQKLVPEEDAKRRKNPFDMWDEMRANAETGKFPKGTDIFLQKYHGLFYVAPAQNSFMCRLRMPNGLLTSHQMHGLADLAVACGGGYSHVTTRANLQIREITAQNAPALLIGIQELGLTSRGSGADNIRNITGGPTAGIDAQEIIDTRPLCREMHHYILNHREMYGLPRKFNIAFDGGGLVSVLEDTNDISFTAVSIPGGQAVPAGVYFRMALGGITGHGDFARDTGVILRPEQCVPVAAAVVRVFIAHGDRTDRKKARLKYVLEKFGLEKFMQETETQLGTSLPRLPLEIGAKRGPRLKHGHVGVHQQKQAGLNYIGVVLPVGRLTADQMRALAAIAERFGSATIRLTVWQNLLISDVPDTALAEAKKAIEDAGLDWSASSIRSAMVACTGSTGCKFAASDTKGHASAIALHLESRLTLDTPINIHLTGCPHSCAQHFIADIGLLGTKVGEDAIEGYHINVGGSAGETQEIAREIYRDVSASTAPLVLERMLTAYLAKRRGSDETFQDFTRRHGIEELQELFDAVPAQAAA